LIEPRNGGLFSVGAVYDRAYLSTREKGAVIVLYCALSRLRFADRAYTASILVFPHLSSETKSTPLRPRLDSVALRASVDFFGNAVTRPPTFVVL
jgi:hypothetical protein